MGFCNSREQQLPTSRVRNSSITSLHNIVQSLQKQQSDLHNLCTLQHKSQLLQNLKHQKLQKDTQLAELQLQQFKEQFELLRKDLLSSRPRAPSSSQQDRNSKYFDLQKRNKELLDQILYFKKKQQKHLLKNIQKISKKQGLIAISKAWVTWKMEVSTIDTSQFLDFGSWIDQESIHLFQKENQQLLEKNKLLELFKQGENPLSRVNVFKFIEEMLDKKFEADLNDFQTKRPLRPVNEFMLDYLVRSYGLKALANKTLNQIIPTLEELYSQNHQYGVIICRLLQLFHPEPISLPLGIFLTKARYEFSKIIKFKQTSKAMLIQAVDLVYSLLQTDRISRRIAIQCLRPEQIDPLSYLVFRICRKIVKLGTTVQNVFDMFDFDFSLELSQTEFTDGIKKVLQMSITPQDFDLLLEYVDFSVSLTKERFVYKFNITTYYSNTKNPVFSVTRSQFLNSLIEAHKVLQIRDVAWLKQWLSFQSEVVHTFDGFQALLMKLEPTLYVDQVNYFFDEASREGRVTNEEFMKVVLKYGIGDKGMKDFSKFYLELNSKSGDRTPSDYIQQLTTVIPERIRKRRKSQLISKSRTVTPPNEPVSPSFGKMGFF